MDTFEWLFMFPLPRMEGAEFLPASSRAQASFERHLKQRNITAANALCHIFQEVLGDDAGRVEELGVALDAMRPDSAGGVEGQVSPVVAGGDLEAPLLGHRMNLGCGDFSLARTQQCTIELFLAALRSLDASLRAAVAEESGQDPGEQIVINTYPDSHRKLLYVAVGLDTEGAEVLAEATDYAVQLSLEGVRGLGLHFDPTAKGHTLAHVKYNRRIRDKCQLYKRGINGETSVLRNIDRIRLLHDKLADLVDLHCLQQLGLLHGSTALHGKTDLQRLQATFPFFFFVLLGKNSNFVEDLRQHFGAEVGLYFLFVRELAWWSLYLSVPAALFCVWAAVSGSEVVYFLFSFVLCVWLRAFTSHWYRQEMQHVTSWGISSMHQASAYKELPNLRFQDHDHEYMHSADYGNVHPAAQRHKKLRRALGMACSASLTLLFVSALSGLVGAEHYAYHILAQAYKGDKLIAKGLSTGLGVVTGIQIKVMDALWDKVSDPITDFECRKTQATFLASKRLKASVVKFITSVSTMLYFAFVEPTATDHADRVFFRQQLSMQLMAQFCTRFIVLGTICNRIGKTYLALLFRRYMHGKDRLPFIEVQVLMEEYSSQRLNDDFLDILIPLSLVAMFGMVCPAVVFLLLLLTLEQFRADTWKLLHTQRRPYPRVVLNIGFFDDVLDLIGRIMIFTHCGIAYVFFGRQRHFQEHESVPFLVIATTGLLLWNWAGWLVPVKSTFAAVEERQHEMQRRKLKGLRTGVAEKVTVQLPSERLAECTNYAALPRPMISEDSHLMECKGLHLYHGHPPASRA